MHFHLGFVAAVFALALSVTVVNGQDSIKITNTKQFISYFKGVANMINYKKNIKDSIERVALHIQENKQISDGDKETLKVYYEIVERKSDSLFDKILNDLIHPESRRIVVRNPAVYVDSINNRFQDIKTADSIFLDRYATITGATKGVIIPWLIENFLLPLAIEFINELLDTKVRNLLNRRLRPLVVIKPWNSLTAKNSVGK